MAPFDGRASLLRPERAPNGDAGEHDRMPDFIIDYA